MGRIEGCAEQFHEFAFATAFAAFEDDDQAASVDDLRQLGAGKPLLERGRGAGGVAKHQGTAFKFC